MTTVLELDMRAPELTPWPSTLLDVAPATQIPNMLPLLGNTGQYLSAACALPELGADCGGPSGAKAVNGFSKGTTRTFSVHALLSCKAPGVTDVMQAELDRVWSVGLESFGVERGFMANVLTQSALATDITATYGITINSPQVAVALLELYASQNYAGLPTLHLPYPLVSLALQLGALEMKDGKLATKLGTPVVAGRGYLSATGRSTAIGGATAGAGDLWAWVTGGVEIEATARVLTEPLLMRDLAGSNNELTVMAERTYGVTVDCLIAGLHFQALTAGA